MRKRLLLFLFFAALPAWSQSGGYTSGAGGSGGFVYTGILANIPASCIVGQVAFITDATAGQNQYNCSATNTWTQNLNSGSGGASTALDNLSAVSINAPITPQATVDLGSTIKPFRDLFLYGAGTYGTNYFRFTGTPGAARTFTLPDASGTLAISATSPITLSAAGAIGGATIVTSSSPGVGIAHFAGSTQAVTSSAVNLANADVTGNLPVGNLNSGTNANNTHFWRGDGTWATAVQSLTGTGIFTNSASAGAVTLTLAGTSGGIPYFSGASTLSTSAALTANMPVIGGGAGVAPAVGTVTGNTTEFATFTGAATASRCIDTDASGNLQVTAADCGTGGGISGLTASYIPLASTATSIGANSHMDDGVTTASTITSSENIAAPSFIVTGTCNSGTAACISLKNGTAPSSFDANSFMLFAPTSITTGYGWKAPAAAATGIVRGDNSSNTVTISQSELSGDATTSGSNAVTVIATHLSSAGPVNQGFTGDATLTAHGVLVGEGTSPVNITAAGSAGECLTSNGASADPTYQTCGVGAGVSSFTGDSALLSNSGSTGAVTATLVNAGAHKYWGNNTGSTTAPAYVALVAADIPSAIPIGNIGSAGLSASGPLAIASTGAISWSGTGDVNSSTQVTSTHITGGTNTDLAVFNSNGNVIPYGGAAACTNQVVTALSAAGATTCHTITSSDVNNTIALTGTDINTSNQVTNGSHITNASIGSSALASSLALTTPAIGAATGTSLLLTGNMDGTVPSVVQTGTFTFGTTGGTFKHSFNDNESVTAGAAITGTLPTAAAGLYYCVDNAYNGSNPNTGVITIATSASGQFIIFTDGTLSATGGNVTSGGAAGDAACVRGVDSTHWMLYIQNGTWTKH